MTKVDEEGKVCEMDNKEFAKILEQRTKKFAIEVIIFTRTIPNNPEGYVIKNQIIKSGTSIGANYREANRARSRAEFISRIKICESEASETCYWLEIIKEVFDVKIENFELLSKESKELLAIFTSITNKPRN